MISASTFARLKKEQTELDHFIYGQRSIQFKWASFWNAKRLKLALLTEIAEFANELRTFKIWAKKEPVNPNKVKEELIDCLCFFLGLVNLYQIDFLFPSPVSFPEIEFNDLLLSFFVKTHHLALVEDEKAYLPQGFIKLSPSQLKTYQEWWNVFQHCLKKLKIESEPELLKIYSDKKDINLGRQK